MTTLSKMMINANLIELGSHLKRAPESKNQKINEVIKLYEDRKIPNITTALNTVTEFASTNKIQLIQADL